MLEMLGAAKNGEHRIIIPNSRMQLGFNLWARNARSGAQLVHRAPKPQVCPGTLGAVWEPCMLSGLGVARNLSAAV